MKPLLVLSAALLTLGCASGGTTSSRQAPQGRTTGINVAELTIAQVQADYVARKYTAVQLVQAYLDRIATYEEHYNAFISMNPMALAEAAQLDRELARTGPRGPLHGVPIVVKDNIDMGGLVTTAGFAGFSKATGGVDMIPAQDAEVVARLRRAGAIILGKTNMPDFAGNGTYSKSTAAGQTFNPYADDRAPGGSSGGSATAVNANFAVLGIGTETGGSIQNPAAAQALVGMKPTFGLVPLHGVVPIDATFRDVVGPITRTVADAAIVLDVIAGPSQRDLASYSSVGKTPAKGYAAALDTASLAGKRFGLVGAGWRRNFLPLAPETRAVYERAVAALKARGAEVVEDPFAGSGWIALYSRQPSPSVGAHDMLVYMQGLGATSQFHSVEEWEKLTGKQMRGGGGRGNPVAVTATERGDDYAAWRKEMRALFRKVLADNKLDGLFFPQAGAPISRRNGDATPNDHPELPSNIINDIGLPTVTFPYAYYADGTPFNLSFIGDLWTDDKLLGWAYDLEQVTRSRVPPTLTTRVPNLTVKPPTH